MIPKDPETTSQDLIRQMLIPPARVQLVLTWKSEECRVLEPRSDKLSEYALMAKLTDQINKRLKNLNRNGKHITYATAKG